MTATDPGGGGGDITLSLFEFFGMVASGLLVGGVTAGGTILLMLRAFLKSPVLVAYVERAFDAIPPERKDLIRKTVEVLDEITDGVPFENKPSLSGSGGAVGV